MQRPEFDLATFQLQLTQFAHCTNQPLLQHVVALSLLPEDLLPPLEIPIV